MGAGLPGRLGKDKQPKNSRGDIINEYSGGLNENILGTLCLK